MTENTSPASLVEVLLTVAQQIGAGPRWIVSGSCAMFLHGLHVSPKDIDLWFHPDDFHMWSRERLLPVEHRVRDGYCQEVVAWDAVGWEVECVGRVKMCSGFTLQVDDLMLQRAVGFPLTQSKADLVAELLTMRRSAPKNDLERARALMHESSPPTSTEIQQRLQLFGLEWSQVDEAMALLSGS